MCAILQPPSPPFLRGILYAIHRITRLFKMKILYNQLTNVNPERKISPFGRNDKRMVFRSGIT